MTTLLAFLLGYVFGARAGESGLADLVNAVETIRSSEEVRDLIEGSISVLKDLVRQGGSMLAERMSPSGNESNVRRIA